QEKVWIIDFDKCYVQSGHSWKQGNLKRLKRSFEKEIVQSNIIIELGSVDILCNTALQ
ncbi:lipopolysaccharide kinase InaA family protein, partial [Vibrio cholerae]